MSTISSTENVEDKDKHMNVSDLPITKATEQQQQVFDVLKGRLPADTLKPAGAAEYCPAGMLVGDQAALVKARMDHSAFAVLIEIDDTLLNVGSFPMRDPRYKEIKDQITVFSE